MSTEAVRVMKQLFASFVLGDKEGVMEFVAPDAVWRFPGDRAVLPWAGEYAGRDLRVFMDAVFDHLDYLEYTAHTFHGAGEVVVILSRERCRVKATGRIFENDLAAVATVREGRVVSFLEYSDTAAMAAAFGDQASSPTRCA